MTRRRRALLWVAGAALVLPVAPAATAAGGAGAKGHCAPARHAGGDWRSYGHDLSNTRSQPAEHTLAPTVVPMLHKAFAFSASQAGGDGDFTGTPVVADGCLFIGSTTGWVFAANADTGQPVWATHLANDYEITSSPFVGEGQVFVAVGRTGSPFVAALDERTGRLRWRTVTDRQAGADAYGSPVVFDGVLFEGVSGGAAELSTQQERDAFEGGYVLVETRGRHAGRVLRKVYTVQAPAKNAQQGGATVWSTPAIDTRDKVAFVGSGNPFHPQTDTPHADAILKIDLNRHSRTFGRIIGYYDGTPEEYQATAEKLPCVDIPGNPPPYYPQGAGSCGDMDMDFGASPNLMTVGGRLLVGDGQKSGYYHLIDARTMKGVWHTPVGPPSAIGGIVGSTAYDGKAIYGPITLGGYLWSLDRATGTPRWLSPIADGAHWGDPVAVADGVVYTVGLTGFLDAYDSATGAPLLHHWMGVDVNAGDLAASWGGVSIARNTVYAAIGMTGLANGYVIGYRAGPAVPGVPGAALSGSAPPAVPGVPGAALSGSAPPPGTSVVAGPQAQSVGYLTPYLVVRRGGSLQFANFDLVRHNVVQDPSTDHAWRRTRASWCSRAQVRHHQCPLFWSRLIGFNGAEQVLGVSGLRPGTYTFYCTLHPGMRGKLIVTS